MKILTLRTSLIVAIITFLLDRFAKAIVLHLPSPVIITPWFSIDCILNRGITWGLFAFDDTRNFIIMSGIITILLAIIMWWTYHMYQRNESITAHLFIVAGGISNILDRMLYGGVIDYIGIAIMRWQFPWFNIADAAITFGVALLIIQGLFHE